MSLPPYAGLRSSSCQEVKERVAHVQENPVDLIIFYYQQLAFKLHRIVNCKEMRDYKISLVWNHIN
jgi:hypothetical protein